MIYYNIYILFYPFFINISHDILRIYNGYLSRWPLTSPRSGGWIPTDEDRCARHDTAEPLEGHQVDVDVHQVNHIE